jgi:chromosome segregation ATPase
MVETPLFKLARLLGGVALMQGRLGHQVLGQLMIAGTNELAVAGAAVVVAGSLQQRDSAAQAVLRTAAPAIALSSIFERREQILLRHERSLQPREKALAARDFELETQYGVLSRRNAKLSQQNADFQTKNADLEKKTTDLNWRNWDLQYENWKLNARTALLQLDNSKLQGTNADLLEQLTFIAGARDECAETLVRVRGEIAALSEGHAALQKKYSLAMDGHDAFAETVTGLRRHNHTLQKVNALCVFDRSILRNRNHSLRQELTALTERLRALESPHSTEVAAAPPDVEGPPPPKKNRAQRRRQQRRARKRNKEREQ